ARLLATTVQALEVQRMTLSTLQTMNLPMADLQNALKLKPQAGWPASSAPAPSSAPSPAPSAPAPSPPPAPTASESATDAPATGAAAAPASTAPAAVDPMQWWTALTEQFAGIVKDSTAAMAAGHTGLPGAKAAAPEGSASPAAPKRSSPAAPRKPASGSRGR
ncbi:MAG: hypothetical protein ABIN96_01455, partial [Rubrivivax sp.]